MSKFKQVHSNLKCEREALKNYLNRKILSLLMPIEEDSLLL